MNFKELNIIPPILRALEEENYEVPTPIQEQAIEPILEGRDLLACAQTGTGKTAAFAIPTIQLLYKNNKNAYNKSAKRKIRALILTPTRELAIQIADSFKAYSKYINLKYGVVLGGVSQRTQEIMLRRGVDVLIATPGRLMDLMNQRLVKLDSVEIFILDEADRMLDMGFLPDVTKIAERTPEEKQTLLFSATIPNEISTISKQILKDPFRINIKPEQPTVDAITQKVYFVDKNNKINLLEYLLKDESVISALVFTRTKRGADRVVKDLEVCNIKALSIHGDKTQRARQTALNSFKRKEIRVLVATDIAARGIDIDELSHVINYDLPENAETYVHRIGRTGRAGLEGTAISFCNSDEKSLLVDIERYLRRHIDIVEDHPFPMLINTPTKRASNNRRRNNNASRRPVKKSYNNKRTNFDDNKKHGNNRSKFDDNKGLENKSLENKRSNSNPGKKGKYHKPSGYKKSNSYYMKGSYSLNEVDMGGSNSDNRESYKKDSYKKDSFNEGNTENKSYKKNNSNKKSYGNNKKNGYRKNYGNKKSNNKKSDSNN